MNGREKWGGAETGFFAADDGSSVPGQLLRKRTIVSDLIPREVSGEGSEVIFQVEREDTHFVSYTGSPWR